MRSQVLRLVCSLLGAILIPSALARRGGSGDSDGDGGSSSGGSDSTGSSSDPCSTPDHPAVWKWDLIPHNANNRTSGGVEGRDTSYDGSFFEGKAELFYNITEEGGLTCHMSAENPISLLGYAWIGPQAPYPVGPTNPIIIGFKAWESRKPLDEIEDSYGYVDWDPGNSNGCPDRPDLFLLTTTYSWTDWRKSEELLRVVGYAFDVLHLDLSATGDSDLGEVQFSGTMVNASVPKPEYRHMTIRMPGRICGMHRVFSMDDEDIDRLGISGSFTNTTLDLTLSGRGTAVAISSWSRSNITVEFDLKFSGRFDSDNSTQKLSLQQRDQALVDWVPNLGIQIIPRSLGWVGSLVCLGAIMLGL
ncbi:uncharacterized protein DSM5745_03206 [Aspergillus mulundensis]|uniref:Uncharacterized protein n=1 Tax=Aspergillus mulundensis TaxID=1810919 RepID=A0A3D8SK34_9EURO|nr:hypothetical protein DSM5745_03206 [Aspergillus mulundensis]RDW86564.1 hypothetical protein DSM5745_03206 [Aspergillus mulundensis]